MHKLIPAEPFTVAIPDAALSDLRDRLARTRWPIEPAGPAWRYGTSLDWLRKVVAYWRESYDWRQAEAAINSIPNYRAALDSLNVHFLVERGSGDNPPALLITHGWPGSIVEFLDIINPLAHPERYGGNVADAFTVVVPSLPGFGFSDPPKAPITPREIAALWHRLMTGVLGQDRYFVAGGDFGAVIGSWLGIDQPNAVTALHLNFAPMRPALGPDAASLAADEEAWIAALTKRTAGELAYQQLQGTKPQTLAYGLTDSPVGLAAWILEKFHGWTTRAPDGTPAVPLDRLLTNVMLYWFAGISASIWMYCALVEGRADHLAPGETIGVPTGFLLSPDDILPPPPQSWLRRSYDLRHYRIAPTGGHFAALENGPLLTEEIRTFFRPYR